MPEPVTQLSVSRFRVHSEDPSFQVKWRGGSRFELSGIVNLTPSADLDVSTPSDEVEVALAHRSTPQHAVTVLRRALPRGILMRHQSIEDGVEIVFQEALVPAAKTPRLRLFSTDAAVRLKQLHDNTIEIQSGASDDTLLTILCDSRRSTLSIAQGTSPIAIAALVAAHVPHGFRALVDGPVVSVWKDADFFSAVA